MIRAIAFLALSLLLVAGPGAAQEAAPDEGVAPRAETGGAQTLEDILRRQRGEAVDDSFRRSATGDPDSAAAITNQLGTLGGSSDADVYRALRYGTADVLVSTPGVANEVVMQDAGMWWLEVRQGPLVAWGLGAMLVMTALLMAFYGYRGRIEIDGGRSSAKILRFNAVERFSHWLLAGSFLLLGVTGILTLIGRPALIPLIGHEAFAILATGCKWVHNNVAWPFMLGLVLVFVLWVLQNIPNRHDLVWMAKGGGLFSKGSHPPARKFNAGQKVIFWAVILLGGSISVSGLSLLFPFELPLFAPTFEKINSFGLPGMVGLAPLPTELAPHEEMQFAQLWHAIVGFALMVIIIAHIYLGSVGMEGAFAAMGDGEVDLQWAREHHGLWVEEVEAQSPKKAQATPAE